MIDKFKKLDLDSQWYFTILNRNSVNGMGLGLSLVNHIIMKYNGYIWAENNVKDDYSKGSNFILLIPEVK